jgi:CHAD domain-containing protein
VKARKVAALESGMALAEAARKIVAVRTDEVYSLAPSALAGRDAVALHQMRIAAKRLRYVLELVGFCLGDVASEAESRMRELQTLIGDIHDCDVLLERLGALKGAEGKGLRRLTARLSGRRQTLFGEFVALWSMIESSGLHDRLAAATGFSPNGAVMGA